MFDIGVHRMPCKSLLMDSFWCVSFLFSLFQDDYISAYLDNLCLPSVERWRLYCAIVIREVSFHGDLDTLMIFTWKYVSLFLTLSSRVQGWAGLFRLLFVLMYFHKSLMLLYSCCGGLFFNLVLCTLSKVGCLISSFYASLLFMYLIVNLLFKLVLD